METENKKPQGREVVDALADECYVMLSGARCLWLDGLSLGLSAAAFLMNLVMYLACRKAYLLVFSVVLAMLAVRSFLSSKKVRNMIATYYGLMIAEAKERYGITDNNL